MIRTNTDSALVQARHDAFTAIPALSFAAKNCQNLLAHFSLPAVPVSSDPFDAMSHPGWLDALGAAHFGGA